MPTSQETAPRYSRLWRVWDVAVNKSNNFFDRHFAGPQGVLSRAQLVKIEADEIATGECSRERADSLSVTGLPLPDAIAQTLVKAFAVAVRYRRERRFKVLFQ